MEFVCSKEQKSALDGLAYRIADNAYMKERYGTDGAKIELEQNRKTILGLFSELDELGVPFWVQNAVICFSENWRAWQAGRLEKHLNSRKIFTEG